MTPAEQLGELLAQVQAVHADQPEVAADLLHLATTELLEAVAPAQRDELLRVGEHVLLGHLDRGEALLSWMAAFEALAETATAAATSPAASPPASPVTSSAAAPSASQTICRRSRAAIALARDGSADLTALPPSMRVLAHFNAALARSRRRDFAAVRSLLSAATAEARAVPADAVAQRALAALANNLAGDMRHYHQAGDAPHAELMIDAARHACQAWQAAGGWLEQERADWQLAMCCAAAGQADEAVQASARTLAACQAQQADDFEFCFAWQAVALARLAARDLPGAQAARAAMADRVAALAEDDAGYAHDCLAEIDQAIARLVATAS